MKGFSLGFFLLLLFLWIANLLGFAFATLFFHLSPLLLPFCIWLLYRSITKILPFGISILNFASLVFIGANFFYQIGPLSQSSKDTKSDNSISIGTLNVNQLQKEESWNSLMELLKKEELDIVFLQEFGSKENWKDRTATIESLRAETGYPHVKFWVQDDNIYGLSCLSRFPFTADSIHYLPISKMNGVISCAIEISKQTVRFKHVHLESNNIQKWSEVKDVLSTEEVRESQIDEYLLNQHQTDILIGDFNTLPLSRNYLKITEEFEDAAMISSNTIATTFSYLPLRLDYIFCRNVEVFKTETLPVDFSDHRLLKAELGI